MNNYGWDSDEVVAAKSRRIAELETDAIARTHDFFNLTKQHEKLLYARELSALASRTLSAESCAENVRIAQLEAYMRKHGRHLDWWFRDVASCAWLN
jgi:hypothetical protein